MNAKGFTAYELVVALVVLLSLGIGGFVFATVIKAAMKWVWS